MSRVSARHSARAVGVWNWIAWPLGLDRDLVAPFAVTKCRGLQVEFIEAPSWEPLDPVKQV